MSEFDLSLVGTVDLFGELSRRCGMAADAVKLEGEFLFPAWAEETVFVVCDEYGVAPVEMLKRGRGTRRHADARCVCLGILRQRFKHRTDDEISAVFGMDHASVAHGCRRVDARMNECADFAKSLGNVLKRLSIAAAGGERRTSPQGRKGGKR